MCDVPKACIRVLVASSLSDLSYFVQPRKALLQTLPTWVFMRIQQTDSTDLIVEDPTSTLSKFTLASWCRDPRIINLVFLSFNNSWWLIIIQSLMSLIDASMALIASSCEESDDRRKDMYSWVSSTYPCTDGRCCLAKCQIDVKHTWWRATGPDNFLEGLQKLNRNFVTNLVNDDTLWPRRQERWQPGKSSVCNSKVILKDVLHNAVVNGVEGGDEIEKNHGLECRSYVTAHASITSNKMASALIKKCVN